MKQILFLVLTISGIVMGTYAAQSPAIPDTVAVYILGIDVLLMATTLLQMIIDRIGGEEVPDDQL